MTVITPWPDLAAAASSPIWRQPDLALDGYLTGMIIAPRPIATTYWQGAVLAGDDLLVRGEGHARVTRDTWCPATPHSLATSMNTSPGWSVLACVITGRLFGRVTGRRRTPRSGAGR